MQDKTGSSIVPLINKIIIVVNLHGPSVIIQNGQMERQRSGKALEGLTDTSSSLIIMMSSYSQTVTDMHLLLLEAICEMVVQNYTACTAWLAEKNGGAGGELDSLPASELP